MIKQFKDWDDDHFPWVSIEYFTRNRHAHCTVVHRYKDVPELPNVYKLRLYEDSMPKKDFAKHLAYTIRFWENELNHAVIQSDKIVFYNLVRPDAKPFDAVHALHYLGVAEYRDVKKFISTQKQ